MNRNTVGRRRDFLTIKNPIICLHSHVDELTINRKQPQLQALGVGGLALENRADPTGES